MSDEKSRLEKELIAVNRGLRVLSAVNEALVRLTSEDELINRACHIAVDAGGYRMAWVGLTEDGGANIVRPACHAGHEGGYLAEMCAALDSGETSCSVINAIHIGEEAICREINAGPEFERGYRSSISLPIRANGYTLGAFNLYSDIPDAFQEDEVALLRQMTNDLGYGIMALQVRTQRDRAEQALRESEGRLHALIDAAPYGAHEYELQPDGSLIFIAANRAADRILGVDHRRFIGKTIEEAFPNLVDTPIPAAYRHVALTGEPYSGDQIIYDQGEISGVFEVSAVPTTPGRVAAFFRDITEKKKAEIALEKERAQLTTAIDLLPFPIFFLDADGNSILRNQATRELTAEINGVTSEIRDRMQLLDPQTRMPIPYEDWPESRALRGETVMNFEAVLRLSSGREFHILAQASPIVLGDKHGAVIAFQDVTPLKEVDRAKNQFLSVLSHELRTPLSAIIGWAGMAQSTQEIVPEALEVVLRNADRMRLLVERLLILTRISAERLGAHPREDDLWKIAQEAARGLKERAERQLATLTMQPPPEPLRVKVDPENIRQALREVMDNAIKFSQLGGGIEVTGGREGNTAHLTIHDIGRGIPADQLTGLLTPFQQLTRDERLGGLGIGLALARGLVEANNGRLDITSPGIGKGATVRMSFPVVE